LTFDSNDTTALIERAKNGDEQAMTRLVTVFKGLVFTVIYRMVGNYHISEDLTQDTFVKVFLNIKKVKNEQHFRAWICTIARNTTRDHFRREKRHPTISLDVVGEQSGQPGLEMTRRGMIIQDALGRLSERDRMLLTLAYYERMSLAEVAEIMRLTEQNVKVCLFRARKRLRKELKGYEHELLPA
jgi:RNA polymerase sigma-70 factor (ECF subfamily)